MASLTLATASMVVDQTLRFARDIDAAPLSVAVLDTGGHVVVLKREDEAGIVRNEVAVGKAWATLGMGLGGRTLEQRTQGAAAFFGAVTAASDGRFIPRTGGVLLRSAEGTVVGAAGVSGDTSEVDERCVLAGVEGTGLTADPGE